MEDFINNVFPNFRPAIHKAISHYYIMDVSLDFQVVLASVVLTIFGFLLISQWYQTKLLPAGPWGLPIVGYMPFLGAKTHETLWHLGQKYGNVFSIRCGKYMAIVLNDWEAVRAALVDQSENFSARPPMFVSNSTIKKNNIGTIHGPLWKKQRRFTLQALKPFSMQKQIRELVARDSVETLIDTLGKFDGKVLDLNGYFFLTILNIVWRMVSGRVISENDERDKDFRAIVKKNSEGMRNSSPLNFLPWLRFVVPGGCGYWKHVKNHNQLCDYLRHEVDEHLRNYQPGQCNDFIDAYIEEIKRLEERNGTQEPPFDMDHLVGTLYGLFLGGTETSTTTLSWGFLFLSLWPHFQRKVQAELDEVIGRHRLPCFEDRSKLPYLEAVIMEVHRYASILCLSLFHSTHKATTVLGHFIPKGVMVIENIYAVHHDPKLWDSPNEFQPERFLNSDNALIKPEYLIPFSVGARSCPGEQIAKFQLFLIFSCLLHKFSFELPPNAPKPSLECDIGLLRFPKPYSLLVHSR